MDPSVAYMGPKNRKKTPQVLFCLLNDLVECFKAEIHSRVMMFSNSATLQRSDGQVRQRIKSAYTPQSKSETMHVLTETFWSTKK